MRTKLDFAPANFFALRTPLLPFDTFQAWGQAAVAPNADEDQLTQALRQDRVQLRAALASQLAQPAINEAIFVASPDLHSTLNRWLEAPDSEKGLRAERALVRYFARMSGRATPFGLFSGCSVGAVRGQPNAVASASKAEAPHSPEQSGPLSSTRFTLAPQASYQRHTRLDMDYLFALCETLRYSPAVRDELHYFPNSSLYSLGGHYRYAEARLNGKVRDYHLVGVEANVYLDATLKRAHGGATPATLALALVNDDPDITVEEATTYVNELIDSQLLVARLAPEVTGREPMHGIIDTLVPHAPILSATLRGVQTALTQVDATGLGVAPAQYLTIAQTLQALPAPVELNRLFQVDMVKPTTAATLGGAVLTELQRGVDLLHRVAPSPAEAALTRFCQRFVERYEGRQLPLMEVLDEELGIGFRMESNADHAPLLAGLHFPASPAPVTTDWGTRQQWLLHKVEAAWRSGVQQIALSEQDLAMLANPAPRPLPNTFALMATVAARSQAALDQGDFAILLEGVSGPSGARLLGRFCHGDPILQEEVTAYLAAEAAFDPAAIYAEVVHLPEGRIGNILCRPVLRTYEIPYLGQSGADPDHQIPVTDLLVSVVRGEVILYSQRLQRRVIPRLTTAHNFTLRGQGVYMFLCALQSQGMAGGLQWDWGALASADFLPRLTYKRLVLARARWRMSQMEIQQLGNLKESELWRALQAWRIHRQLPRFVVLADGDNELPIDLDNLLSVESFIDLIKNRTTAVLTELFPGPDELCAAGPEGAFVHEIVVPFLKTRDGEPGQQKARQMGFDANPIERRHDEKQQATCPKRNANIRTFPPGSEWLYVKLYTGAATADRVLCEVIAPVVRQAMATGAAAQWFFVRYGDPDWHVRLRIQGDPARLLDSVLPQLHALAAPWLADRRIWKLQLDTYEREVERYGGPVGITLAERLFHADSEAVLSVIERLDGDAGADARWRLTYAGMDRLLDDLGFDLTAKQTLAHRACVSFQREFQADSRLRSQLGKKHRGERQDLTWLLDAARQQTHPLAPGIDCLTVRSAQLRPIVGELQTAEQQRQLSAPLAEIAWSYLHMHANRLLRSTQRSQELVLYELLDRQYATQQARQQKH